MSVREVSKSGKSLVAELMDEAKEELSKEVRGKAKSRIKTLLSRRSDAKKVLDNIDREIKELELTISQEVEAL